MSEENPLEETIEQIAVRLVAEAMARYAAERAPTPPTEAELRAQREQLDVVRDTVAAHNALPRARRHIEREAMELFESREGALVARGNLSEPGNPLRPLTLHAWLLQLSEDEPYLFEPHAGQQ